MDLRPLITSKSQIDEARRLALRGLLSYQPYIFSDNFATGAGLSILAGHLTDPPAVYCKDATANDTDPTFFAREFAKENQREEFFSANQSMRRFYDGMVDQIANAVGPLDDMWFSMSAATLDISRLLLRAGERAKLPASIESMTRRPWRS